MKKLIAIHTIETLGENDSVQLINGVIRRFGDFTNLHGVMVVVEYDRSQFVYVDEIMIHKKWIKTAVSVTDSTLIHYKAVDSRYLFSVGDDPLDIIHGITFEPQSTATVADLSTNRYKSIKTVKCPVCGRVCIGTDECECGEYKVYLSGDYAHEWISLTKLITLTNGDIRSIRSTDIYRYTMCSDCGNYYLTNGDGFFGGNDGVCSICENNIRTCDRCGDMFSNDDNDEEHSLCESCQDEARDFKFQIHNWSYKPNPIFMTLKGETSENTVFYGVELEVCTKNEYINDAARLFMETLEEQIGIDNAAMFYMKSDASINNGFEIVSHPFSMGWMKANMDSIQGLFDTLEDQRLIAGERRGETTCGMHVHISKGPIPENEIFKFASFVYLNKLDILKVGDRRNMSHVDSYCCFPPNLTELDLRYMGKRKNNPSSIEHHSALQFTPATMEIRIFDGVSEIDPFLVNIQMVESIRQFVKDRRMVDMSFITYYEFVKNNIVDYGELFERLENIDLEFSTRIIGIKDYEEVDDEETSIPHMSMSRTEYHTLNTPDTQIDRMTNTEMGRLRAIIRELQE